MKDQETQKLEIERALGEQHQRAWENTIEPFFKHKEKEIFDAFCDSSSNKDAIFELKLQQNALESLRLHFETYINTGKMSSQVLNEGERNGD